jgi:hypothetical protein
MEHTNLPAARVECGFEIDRRTIDHHEDLVRSKGL